MNGPNVVFIHTSDIYRGKLSSLGSLPITSCISYNPCRDAKEFQAERRGNKFVRNKGLDLWAVFC